MENEKNTFTYTYSATDNDEVKRIRQKYMAAGGEDKLTQLRQLDQSVTKRGQIIAIVVGVVSTLILGVGMCCTMLWSNFFVIGVIIGVLGLVGCVVTYPLYTAIVKKDREKLAPKIIALSNELIH